MNLTGLKGLKSNGDDAFYDASQFQLLLQVERRRTERSKKPFILMLVDLSAVPVGQHPDDELAKLRFVLLSGSRETDIRGWYEQDKIMGIIFTEVTSVDKASIEHILKKVNDTICDCADMEWAKKIKLAIHVFPEENGHSPVEKAMFNTNLYPDSSQVILSRPCSSSLKKIMDFFGSLFALIFFSPLFLILAAAVKLTSRGPVLFQQERVGLNGETFTFLKFRSMFIDCDPDRHKAYITKFIGEGKDDEEAPGVYKLSNDSRVTPFGRFLRKTSLDELPQFINVLKGEMSLVGPRPPIPYECDIYDIWHRRRLLSVKPGITGLWQVTGRSSTTFDEMVRLDLKYINEWSLGLDIKILFMTPWVILTGKGAY
jgi:exopolysaccharide biosynthesis polyprenyl glycosylphosphotransferase